ncbi:hypothetical protein KVR01_009512 [Diaporthe batatas]|uniref:uncharacterized protein n=1 Tax=Diaporthe batatas TaxID=748121 RepID=UPI001D05816E|nr:uncharacterized protein KVR01_009512 [Diaporthe batatas]KAG8161248.1 hypothetical protein KVR01_009512 [Diaporthe batatas]
MAGNKDSTSKPGPARQDDRPPPSYDSLYPPRPAARPAAPPSSANASVEDFEPRSDGSPRRTLTPPRPQSTPFKTAEAAAETAMYGTVRAFRLSDKTLVAADIAHAIAVAVSTSRSYTAFVAATTAAENAALLLAHNRHRYIPDDQMDQLINDAIRRAAEHAVAVDAGNTPTGSWPSDTRDGA